MNPARRRIRARPLPAFHYSPPPPRRAGRPPYPRDARRRLSRCDYLNRKCSNTLHPFDGLAYGDHPHVLRNSLVTDSVDPIHLDSPFNSKRDYNSLRGYPNASSPVIVRSRNSLELDGDHLAGGNETVRIGCRRAQEPIPHRVNES
jgi:hypothetical protein